MEIHPYTILARYAAGIGSSIYHKLFKVLSNSSDDDSHFGRYTYVTCK